jgi:hypothetical protein
VRGRAKPARERPGDGVELASSEDRRDGRCGDGSLLPEIQACAATAIYRAKLSDAAGGMVTIPIDFSY